VSIREGAAQQPADGQVIMMGPGGSEPGGIDYTMSISFADGPPFEIGITIPGGEPDKPSTDQPDK
jgi:hypothetical protein